MINDITQLLSELQTGMLVEHHHTNVELKQTWTQDAGKKISSQANKLGVSVAWIVVGVSDNGRSQGRDTNWAKRTEEEISGHLNQYLDPLQACQSVESFQSAGAWIVVLRVANPGALVYWNGTSYKSAGSTIAQMHPEEEMQVMVSLPGLHDYSAQPWAGQTNSELVRAFCRRVAKESNGSHHGTIDKVEPEDALFRLGIKHKTVSKLLFGTCPFRLVFYDAAGVPKRNETVRPLYRLFEQQLYDEVENWARQFRGSADRIYPPRAFQEGIANAVAHTAYFEGDGDVMLEVYHDHLSISNLCTRESTYFANKWFSRNRKSVNPLLMETLRLARHVDELGRGKTLIFRDYIASGRPAPRVAIEHGGRYSRWRLLLSAGVTDERQLRLLQRLKEHYEDDHKALMAFALVLWRDRPVGEIRNFVDGESAPIFVEILEDMSGATFYDKDTDKIILNRWAALLLEEGVDSKALTTAEEERLYTFSYMMRTKYYDGLITPQAVRDLADLGNTTGARSISSKLLKKWEREGKVSKVRVGQYRFVQEPTAPANKAQLTTLLMPYASESPF